MASASASSASAPGADFFAPWTPASGVAAAEARLRAKAHEWRVLPTAKKLEFIERMIDIYEQVWERLLASTFAHRGLDYNNPEHHIFHFQSYFGFNINKYAEMYRGLVALGYETPDGQGKAEESSGFTPPSVPVKLPQLKELDDGRKVYKLSPASGALETALLSGDQVEVHFAPGSKGQDLQMDSREPEGVTAVFVPGNYESPWDLMHILFTEGRCVMAKTHYASEPTWRIIAQIFAPLVDAGYLIFVEGGLDMAKEVLASPCDNLCFTGNWETYDAIVWGAPDEREERKSAGRKSYDKPVLAELGGIGAYTVVPGEWTDDELRHAVSTLVGSKMNNGGAICMSPQVIITDKNWPQRDAFWAAFREMAGNTAQLCCYYPGTDKRVAAFKAAYGDKVEEIQMQKVEGVRYDFPLQLALDVDPTSEFVTQTEFFGPGLVEVCLPIEGGAAVSSAADFMNAALSFVNNTVRGNLSGGIIIDPRTEAAHKDVFENYLDNVEVGVFAVNTWAANVTIHGHSTIGAFPGNEPEDILSGAGKLQNAYRLDGVLKTVLRSPFVSPGHIRGGRSGPKEAAGTMKKQHRLIWLSCRPSWGRFLSLASAVVLGL
jgi:aldehyde dehydrogenase (NAD(P)+)